MKRILIWTGLLAGVAGVALWWTSRRLPYQNLGPSLPVRVMQDLSVIEVALKVFRLDCGRYPKMDEGLNALVEPPEDPALLRWEPTLKAELIDPWGKPYAYRHPPARQESFPDVFSAGPDGQFGTADDIGNWLER